MKKNTVSYYRDVIKAGQAARFSIARAMVDFDTYAATEKKWLEAGDTTEKHFRERMQELAASRDQKIEQAQKTVLDIAAEFEKEAKAATKLDGAKIDSDTLRIIDSGFPLTLEDWQELKKTHKDNWIMSRLLQAKYDKNPIMRDNGTGLMGDEGKEKISLKFGVDPMERSKTFSQFASLISHSAASGTSGGQADNFKDQDSYWNHCARASLKNIAPIEDDDFSTADADFPVEFAENTSIGMVW